MDDIIPNLSHFSREIIMYSRSTINAYSEFSGTHHSCERREYTFMILQEYLIIFHFSLPKMNLTSSSTFLLVHDPDFDFFSKDRKKVDEEICPLNRLGPSLLDIFWLGLHSLKSTLVLKLSSIL